MEWDFNRVFFFGFRMSFSVECVCGNQEGREWRTQREHVNYRHLGPIIYLVRRKSDHQSSLRTLRLHSTHITSHIMHDQCASLSYQSSQSQKTRRKRNSEWKIPSPVGTVKCCWVLVSLSKQNMFTHYTTWLWLDYIQTTFRSVVEFENIILCMSESQIFFIFAVVQKKKSHTRSNVCLALVRKRIWAGWNSLQRQQRDWSIQHETAQCNYCCAKNLSMWRLNSNAANSLFFHCSISHNQLLIYFYLRKTTAVRRRQRDFILKSKIYRIYSHQRRKIEFYFYTFSLSFFFLRRSPPRARLTRTRM